jgi:predicted nucleotidyltransferase
MRTDPIVRQLRNFFASRHHELVCAYLYGSQARGDADRHSDVDIALLFKERPPSTLDGMGLDLAAEIEAAIGKPVDLVILNRAPADLIHRILRDGILLHETDPSARISFEVHARGVYFDLLPYLRQYRRSGPEQQP